MKTLMTIAIALSLPFLARGSRMYFGSLLVGYYGWDGLLLAGRVGTDFFEKALATLSGGLQKIKRTTCPFVNLP